MERSFEERNVAQQRQQAAGNGVSFETATLLRQQDEGQVRPGLLPGEPRRQELHVGADKRLFGRDHECRAVVQFTHGRREIGADGTSDAGLGEHSRCDRPVPTQRSQYDRAVGQGFPFHASADFSSSGPAPNMDGTPRSTPWKFVRGSPSVMPFSPI
jgi:hypothetical protein